MIDTETAVEATSTPAAPAPTASPTDGASSLGADIDAMFGYRAPAREASPADDEDDTPASPSASETTGSGDSGQLGTDASQPTTETAVVAVAPTDDDPLKDATPLTYSFNGETRSDDRIKVVKDFGAVIDAADLPHLQHRLAERDQLEAMSREHSERLSQLETLTSWPKRDAQNQVIGTLTGREAIEAARIDYGNAMAKLNAYEQVLNDPAKLAALLTFDPNSQTFGLDDDQKARLAMQIENLQLKIVPAIQKHLASLASPASARQEESAPATYTPPPASAVVSHAITQSGIAGLTDADKAWAASIAPRYVRQATAEDVRANPTLTVGAPMLEGEFLDVLKDRAALRADLAKKVDAATAASRENAPKLAAALVGKQPARPAVPAKPSIMANDDTLSPEEEAYLRFERSGAAALRARTA